MREKEIQRGVLNQCKLFGNLSAQSQCRIVYEVGTLVTFKPNEVAFKWHKRSTWNVNEYH